MPIAYRPTTSDGRAIAQNNEISVLKAIRHFGHLRRQEVAMAVWPSSSDNSGYNMAWRTVKRLLSQGQILERPNSLGGKSLILGAKGVQRLRSLDIAAHEGYDLAFDGPQFFHRTLGTCYLLEKARTGNQVFGEYSLLRGWSPLNREYLSQRFTKIPDGLVVYSAEALGLRKGFTVADWVEVESAHKSYEDVKRALSLLSTSASLTKEGNVTLNKLVFVYDSRQTHERRILRYIKKFLQENPKVSPNLVMEEIIFAKCFIEVPLTWRGVVEATASEVLRDINGSDSFETLTDTDY